MIKFVGTNNSIYYIARNGIVAIWSHDNVTIIEVENNSFYVKETVEEALTLWEATRNE